MAGSAQAESLGFLCNGCNYPLRGLTEHRCPECGRAFDPHDATTMNIGRALGRWQRFWLKPPGRIFHAIVALAALATLAADSAPGGYFLLLLLVAPLWLLVGAWWGWRALAFLLTSYFRRQPLYWHQLRWIWWVVAPFIVVSTAGALRLNIPMRVTFRLSRPVLERVAKDALAGKSVAGQTWLGLYPIGEISVDGQCVHFYLRHTGFLDRHALTYSPNFTPPAENGEVTHEHYRGPWYLRCEAF